MSYMRDYGSAFMAEAPVLDGHTGFTCVFEHFEHIAQDGVCIEIVGQDIALVPEFLVAFAHRCDEAILLHIAR